MNKHNDKLETIPGVGKSITKDLHELGIHKVSDLIQKNPQQLYDDLCKKRNVRMDLCVLYVFRCAIYFAENDNPKPELLKWWNWKNK